jgi:hypothetical protein
MSTISITKLYDLLSTKLGKETAENLANFIENKIDNALESKTQILATKEDLARSTLATKEDIAKLALGTKEDLAKYALATKEDLGKLDTKISETKSELMKWMFIFWASQLIAIFSFILLFFRK